MAKPEKVAQLVSMGYTESEAEQALDFTGGDMEQAVGYLLLSASQRGAITGEAPPAASAPRTDTLPAFYPPPEPVGNLKPPPQYSTPPPAPPAANNYNRKPPPPSSSQPTPPLEDTMDALKISGTPLQQTAAVDFVPGVEIPQRGFGNIAVPAMTSFRSTVSDVTDVDGMRTSKSLRADAVIEKKIMELVEMGYPMNDAEQALAVSDGNLGQAIDFLLLPSEMRQQFLGAEVMDSFHIGGSGGGSDPSSETDGDAREKANQFLKDEQERERLQQEQLKALRKKEEEVLAGHATQKKQKAESKQRPSYTPYQTSVNASSGKNVPKMVVTNQGAGDIGSRPFCTCVAARNFLRGGMVNSSYLNSIVQEGHDLYVKAGSGSNHNIPKVMMRFGRTDDLGLVSKTAKMGSFEAENLKGDRSLRALLAIIRNEQQTGWEVVVMEVGDNSFCICLPPKGSANKYWLLDLVGRPEFRTEGAYARVHISLLQLEESLEYVMKIQRRKLGIAKQDFKLFVVKKYQK